MLAILYLRVKLNINEGRICQEVNRRFVMILNDAIAPRSLSAVN